MTEILARLDRIIGLLEQLMAAIVPPAPPEEPLYVCKSCGSPRWVTGGMGDLFRKCYDCGLLSDELVEPKKQQ